MVIVVLLAGYIQPCLEGEVSEDWSLEEERRTL